ncbi:MAG: phosphonate C-P lyase system protein PhnG [Oryzomonas sp.]|uniref:phosphonate C-P lyase system protein PhnG n=1 Tax=Oryzomonas sp. TaxID=2855186 RepID=UPI0028444691|nr:phosphonate C-P lyase system protein PhnG [Oryzomonas sp.]MDR3581256.1 phosphonate C-P lyase system protein PhnG [Oryzomonas sp.]
MDNIDMTAAVIGMNDREINELIELLATEEMTITRPPRSGLIMMTVKDSFDTDFHLGEVLVTEATVSVGGNEGFGMVTGEEPRKALARAAADALLRAGRPERLCEAVQAFLSDAQNRQTAQVAAEAALTATTRVSFDLMPGA